MTEKVINAFLITFSIIWVISLMILLWMTGAQVAAVAVPFNIYIIHTLIKNPKQKKEEKKCQE